jgi:hypothetical protein
MGSSFNDTQGLPCCGASALEMTPELLCGSDHRSTSPVTASLERSEERAKIDKGERTAPGLQLQSSTTRLSGTEAGRWGAGTRLCPWCDYCDGQLTGSSPQAHVHGRLHLNLTLPSLHVICFHMGCAGCGEPRYPGSLRTSQVPRQMSKNRTWQSMPLDPRQVAKIASDWDSTSDRLR